MMTRLSSRLLNISCTFIQRNPADYHSAPTHVREFKYVLRCAGIGMNRQAARLTFGHIAEYTVRMFSTLRPEVGGGRRIVTHQSEYDTSRANFFRFFGWAVIRQWLTKSLLHIAIIHT